MLQEYEKELFSATAYYEKKRKGVLTLTNVKLMWCSSTQPLVPQISLYLLDLLNFLHLQKEGRKLLKLETRKQFKGKDFLVFAFRDKSSLQKFPKLTRALEDIISQREVENHEWKPTNQEKQHIQTLQQNEFIRHLHSRYVMRGLMSEEDFWRDLNLREHQVEDTVGAPSKLTLLTKTHNPKTDTWEISFNYEMGEILKRLYPQLNQAFGVLVPLQMKEKEFWEEFVKYQDIHETEVTGGLNPMKMPQKFVDVLEYPFEESKEQVTVEDKGLRSKDLELLLNNEGEKLRTGYGTQNANQLMELDQVLSLDARESATAESKAERLMRTVNTKSEKILKEAEAMDERPVLEDQLKLEEQEEEPAMVPQKSKKEQQQFLSDQAIQDNHRVWIAFTKIVQAMTKADEEKTRGDISPSKVMEIVEEMTEKGSTHKLPSVPEGVERAMKKHQKSVNNALRLFYSQFPIPKKKRGERLEKLKNLKIELDELENILKIEMTKPNILRFKGLFHNIFQQIHKAQTVYAHLERN